MEDGDTNWYDSTVATMGDRLAAAREAAGMDQDAMAKRVGVKLSTLVKWEDDVAEPRANRLQMISGILGVSITWLLTGTGEGVEPPSEEPGGLELESVLIELRQIRSDFTRKAEQVGRLEKRLRKMIAVGTDG